MGPIAAALPAGMSAIGMESAAVDDLTARASSDQDAASSYTPRGSSSLSARRSSRGWDLGVMKSARVNPYRSRHDSASLDVERVGV